MLQKYNSKNDNILVYVDGHLVTREQAKISVFDSSVQGGDAVWEGLRVYNRGIFCLDRHLSRLDYSAKALMFNDIPSKEDIKLAIVKTLEANKMYDEVHIRLTLTRGEKITSGMDPRLNQSGSCLIVLAEWKPLVYDNNIGIRVITSSHLRNSPHYLDSKIHHANLLNNIQAKIQANFAGVDAAVMLDQNGFVSELNDVNLFMVKNRSIFTPHADACLNGITRGIIIDIAHSLNLQIIEKNLSLSEFYNADEVFTSGTMGELTPIVEIDGRKIENRTKTNILEQLRKAFQELIPKYCETFLKINMEHIFEFDAILQTTDKDKDSGFIRLPLDVLEEFGTIGQVKVDATFDGYRYRGSIANKGKGHFILIRKDVRKAIN